VGPGIFKVQGKKGKDRSAPLWVGMFGNDCTFDEALPFSQDENWGRKKGTLHRPARRKKMCEDIIIASAIKYLLVPPEAEEGSGVAMRGEYYRGKIG